MTRNAFIIAAGANFVAGLIMTIVGHYNAFVRDNVFAIGGMLIAMAAGLIYARLTRGGWRDSLTGGGVTGAVGAVLAIAVSVLLGDTPAFVLLVGGVASLVTGLIGGAVGKLIG